MARLIAETTFLIDLEREAARQASGPATEFLNDHAAVELAITPIIAGELACGVSLAARNRWHDFVSRFRWLPHDDEVAWHYGLTYRYLQTQGLLIGANDLWIAATGLANRVPILTRNVPHYERVPGLEVLAY